MHSLSPFFSELLHAPMWSVFGYYMQVPFAEVRPDPGPGDDPGDGPTQSSFWLAY